MADWLDKKANKYTSSEVQNEILQVMSKNLMRKLLDSIRNTDFYTIMIDETTDISNKEQVVFCLRWVDENLDCNEDFLGLYFTELTNASTLTAIVKDVLLRANMALCKCRGQCYDGCSTMSGVKTGVAAQIKAMEPRALFTHCYGHVLNLACADCIKQLKVIKHALDTTLKITKLVEKSPKRNSKLDKIKIAAKLDEDHKPSPNLRLLCPTRWTVRAEALHSIIENYEDLHEQWEWSVDNCTDTEMKARIRGVAIHMDGFDFYFGLTIGREVLRHADNLSTGLQNKSISAAEGQETCQNNS